MVKLGERSQPPSKGEALLLDAMILAAFSLLAGLIVCLVSVQILRFFQ